MPFNSFEYFLFFIVVFTLNWLLYKTDKLRIAFLLVASWYFYASNNGLLLLLLLASTLIDFVAGIVIEDNAKEPLKRKTALVVSLLSNLGMLGFFKYGNFFIDNAFLISEGLGMGISKPVLDIMLPVGISFYTFQSMSYSIDVYNGKLEAERSFTRFAFFVAFFPQLVAGPIVRARYFLHQIPHKPFLSMKGLEASLFLIASGLIKKMVLGDTLGDYADIAFADPAGAHAVVAWVGLLAFTFQIYFDFSGYTDVTIGCARLLGYRLPPNFRRPYVAVSFSEFWRRWHISLSFWLRDYLYKPLGGNRSGPLGTYRNLFLVMLLGGLWHGAAWTFVVWGGLHGLYLAAERFFKQVRFKRQFVDKPIERALRSVVVFVFCMLAWLPFRAASFSDLTDYVGALCRFDVPLTFSVGMGLSCLLIAGGYAMQWIGDFVSLKRLYLKQSLVLRALFLSGTFLLILVFSTRGVQPFIYFRF